MSDGARVCDGPAARRRDRRLRQWLRHERLSIRMNVAEMRHHAAPQPTHIHVGTQTASPVIDYMGPAPVMTDITSLLEPPKPCVLTGYVVPAPAATYAASASPEHMPAPVIEYIAPPPAQFFPSFSLPNEAIASLMNPQIFYLC